jgi:type II secretory pathway component PulC
VVVAGPSWQSAVGLQAGDVIVRINNTLISRAEQVDQIVQRLQGKGGLYLWYVRGTQVIGTQVGGAP